MVNVTCCGEQDRLTTASETHPNRPPNETKNCYLTDGEEGVFDYSNCEGVDTACHLHGNCEACTPDLYGGYCAYKDKFYISAGNQFAELTAEKLLDRISSDARTEDITSRIMKADRRTSGESRKNVVATTPPSSSPSLAWWIGISLSLIIAIISFILLAVKKNLFKDLIF